MRRNCNNYCGKNMRLRVATTGGWKSNLGLDRRKQVEHVGSCSVRWEEEISRGEGTCIGNEVAKQGSKRSQLRRGCVS